MVFKPLKNRMDRPHVNSRERGSVFDNLTEAFPLCDRLESMGGKAGLCGFFNLN